MSQENFIRFLAAVRDRPGMRARYGTRNLSQVLFHARGEGYDFAIPEVLDAIGMLEANVVLNKDGDPFDGSSRLWARMWGVPFLDYLVDHVLARHTDDELRALLAAHDGGAA